jgi:hypothetical protein
MLDWSLALIMGNILPPRDPNEDDDDKDEDMHGACDRRSEERRGYCHQWTRRSRHGW